MSEITLQPASLSFGGGFSYILILLLSCVEYYFHYKFINYIKKDLTEKQKAYILSIKSSLTLVLIGLYFNYYYFISNFNLEKFFSVLEQKNSLNFGKVVILYFSAFLIMDIYIGNKEYPSYMKSLSGNFHHGIYTCVNMISLYYGVYPIYLLHMLSELPTFLLSIGSFDSSFRNDKLFGITFFMTRIFYHIILTIIFRKNNTMFYLSLAALLLHLYWFYGWCVKYGKKSLYKKKSVNNSINNSVNNSVNKLKNKSLDKSVKNKSVDKSVKLLKKIKSPRHLK
jgi:hypothetical protein